MTTFQDDFSWWQKALKGDRGMVHDGEPMSGFYRGKNQLKQMEAYAYWKDSATGAQRCHRNGKELSHDSAMQSWLFVNAHPISEETYWTFIDTGKWTDEDAGTAKALANGPAIDPKVDPRGSLEQEIKTAAVDVPKYLKIESDEASAAAQTLRSNLTTMKGRAIKLHKIAKEPSLEEGRSIDREWFPLRDLADDLAGKIAKAQGEWEDVKRDAARAAARETQRLADEAARKAREEQEAHDKAVREAEAANKPAPPPPEPKPAPAPVVVVSNAPPPASQIKGASGRAVAVKVLNIVTIDNEAEVYAFLAGDPDLTALLLKLAQKKTDAGITVPGTHTTEKSKV